MGDPPYPSGDARALWREGSDAYAAGRVDAAVALYTQALEHRPRDARLLSNRSAAYLACGKFEKALDDAHEVLARAPEWHKGYIRAAMALRCAGRYREAIERLEEAGALAPGGDEAGRREVATLLRSTESEEVANHALLRIDSPRASPARSRSPAAARDYYTRLRSRSGSPRPHRPPTLPAADDAPFDASPSRTTAAPTFASPTAARTPAGGRVVTDSNGNTFTTYFTSPSVSRSGLRPGAPQQVGNGATADDSGYAVAQPFPSDAAGAGAGAPSLCVDGVAAVCQTAVQLSRAGSSPKCVGAGMGMGDTFSTQGPGATPNPTPKCTAPVGALEAHLAEHHLTQDAGAHAQHLSPTYSNSNISRSCSGRPAGERDASLSPAAAATASVSRCSSRAPTPVPHDFPIQRISDPAPSASATPMVMSRCQSMVCAACNPPPPPPPPCEIRPVSYLRCLAALLLLCLPHVLLSPVFCAGGGGQRGVGAAVLATVLSAAVCWGMLMPLALPRTSASRLPKYLIRCILLAVVSFAVWCATALDQPEEIVRPLLLHAVAHRCVMAHMIVHVTHFVTAWCVAHALRNADLAGATQAQLASISQWLLPGILTHTALAAVAVYALCVSLRATSSNLVAPSLTAFNAAFGVLLTTHAMHAAHRSATTPAARLHFREEKRGVAPLNIPAKDWFWMAMIVMLATSNAAAFGYGPRQAVLQCPPCPVEASAAVVGGGAAAAGGSAAAVSGEEDVLAAALEAFGL